MTKTEKEKYCSACGRELVEKEIFASEYGLDRFDRVTGKRVDRAMFYIKLVCPKHSWFWGFWHDCLPNGTITKDTYDGSI